MGFSEQEKLEELEYLRDFLNDVEIASEVIPKNQIFVESTLLICLPSVEDIMEGDEVVPEKMHVASAYLLDLDDTEKRLAKYLLFYTQIKTDISALSTMEVILLLNELNRTVRVGHYFFGEVDGEEAPMVQYRATITGADGENFDGGLVADTILEMGVGYDMVKDKLMQANEDCRKRKGI